LNEQGIAVYVTNPVSLDDVFRNMKQLGDFFGTAPEAVDVIASLKSRTETVRPEAASGTRPRVFVQISNEPLFTIGRESFLTELIEKAGGDSATKGVATAYPKLSKETAAALDPDVIILSNSEDNRKPSNAFKDSRAVRNGRVYSIDPDILSRPGPRLVDALEEIAAKLKEEK
jgi:iron complex transport system substrate-binding protein